MSKEHRLQKETERHLKELNAIENGIGAMKESMKSVKSGIETINLKGVKFQ